MKKFTLAVALFACSLGMNAQSQIDLPITWDDTANVDYTTIAFEGGTSAHVVDPTDANNMVLQFTKPTGAQPWAGVTLGNPTLANPIPFTDTDKIISVRVHSEAAGMPIMLKAEVAGNPGIFAEAQDTTTVAGGWEILTFDFNTPTNGGIDTSNSYSVLSFFGDFLTTAADQVFYVDKVYFGTTPMVTFQVDMRKYGTSFTSVELNGSFNGWCGTCNPMSDNDMDGIWDVTLPLWQDSIEFKYTHDNWTGQEEFTPGDACTKTTGPYTNRFITINGDTTLPVACWGECSACTFDVTFRVDMIEYTGSYGTVNLNGTFNGWNGSSIPMNDDDNDSIFEVTVAVPAFSLIEWKFTLDGWTAQEEFTEGDPCTMTTSGFTNRFMNTEADSTLPVYCFNACSACDTRTLSVEDADLANFSVYPNPASTVLYVDGLQNNANITIVDMLGKQVGMVNTNNAIARLDISDLTEGIYILNIQTENTTRSTRVIISH